MGGVSQGGGRCRADRRGVDGAVATFGSAGYWPGGEGEGNLLRVTPPRWGRSQAPHEPAGRSTSPTGPPPGPRGDPANPQAFDPSCEQQVLDGACTRPQAGVREGRATEHPACRRTSVAGHHQSQRGLADAFEPEVQEPPGRVGFHLPRLAEPLLVGHPRRSLPGRGLGDHDEPPWLAVSDRRRHVGRGQHPVEDLGPHRIRPVPADVPAGAEDV